MYKNYRAFVTRPALRNSVCQKLYLKQNLYQPCHRKQSHKLPSVAPSVHLSAISALISSSVISAIPYSSAIRLAFFIAFSPLLSCSSSSFILNGIPFSRISRDIHMRIYVGRSIPSLSQILDALIFDASSVRN